MVKPQSTPSALRALQPVFLKNLELPVAIIGLGVSGRAIHQLLIAAGVEEKSILLFDEKSSLANFKDSNELLLRGQPRTLVVSPGVPLASPWIQEARQNGIRITSELALAQHFLTTEKMVAITGSVGKSTTTSLLGAALARFSKSYFVGGNLGTPLASYVLELFKGERSTADWVILELSSYQLENYANLLADFSIITYLTANHLERYPNKQAYYETKWELYKKTKSKMILNRHGGDLWSWLQGRLNWAVNSGGDTTATPAPNATANSNTILNPNANDDVDPETNAPDIKTSAPTTASSRGGLKATPPLTSAEVIWTDRHQSFMDRYHLTDCKLLGQHNLDNIALAAELMEQAHWPLEAFEGLRDFRGLPHRVENLGERQGIRWINDSKATTIESVKIAVASTLETVPTSQRLHLLLGGRDKNLPWEDLKNLASDARLKFYFFGECREIAANKSGLAGEKFRTLKEALDGIRQGAFLGDSILLSPGGTSLDEFKSFEHRGDFFKDYAERTSVK